MTGWAIPSWGMQYYRLQLETETLATHSFWGDGNTSIIENLDGSSRVILRMVGREMIDLGSRPK